MSWDRYTSPGMRRLWSASNKLATWAYVEYTAAFAMGAPPEVLAEMRQPVPTPEAVAVEEQHTRHDVVAFLNVWSRGMAPEAKSWVHRGMTSSDLVDSANALLLDQAFQMIEESGNLLLAAMANHALRHWGTQRVARTHGQHAEVSTWGYRVADFTRMVQMALSQISAARNEIATVKLSGPVGDYKRIDPYTEVQFAKLTGMNRPITATQVLSRDRYAAAVFACARLATAVEAFATEVRLGSIQEVMEFTEAKRAGQVGSSAMPHKENPITAENLVSVARMVRSQVPLALEDVALWWERDLSHSAVERVMLPMVTTLTEYLAVKAADLIGRLEVHSHQMAARVNGDPEVFSAAAKDWLMAQGLDRELAANLVARACQLSRQGYGPLYTTVPRIVRQAMDHRGEAVLEGMFPDSFAPNWVEFNRVVAVGVDGHLDRVKTWLETVAGPSDSEIEARLDAIKRAVPKPAPAPESEGGRDERQTMLVTEGTEAPGWATDTTHLAT